MPQLNIIIKNPFRILGVASNSGKRDLIANKHKMMAYAKLNKPVSFEMDLVRILHTVLRSEERIQEAEAKINLPEDRIRYALFWFCKDGEKDELALKDISEGNISGAEANWSCSRSYSALINMATLSLIRNNTASYLKYLTQMAGRYTYREQFVSAVCGSEFHYDASELYSIAFSELLAVYPARSLRDAVDEVNDYELKESFGRLALKSSLEAIENELQISSKKDLDSALDYRREAERLLVRTEHAVLEIKELSSGSSSAIGGIRLDELADRIMSCANGYYRESGTDDQVTANCRRYLTKASEIAASSSKKEECKERIKALEAEQYLIAIRELSDDLDNSSGDLNDIVRFLDQADEELEQVVCSGISTQSEEYVAVSTFVVRTAMNAIIGHLNGLGEATPANLNTHLPQFERAVRIIGRIRNRPMKSECSTWLENNYKTILKNRDLMNSAKTIMAQKGNQRSSQNSGSGCLQIIIGAIILFVIFNMFR
jgi:hypothetical protein